MQRLVKDLNEIYKAHPALWKLDTDPSGFSWINADDHGGNVFSFLRYDGEGQMIACIANFSAEPRPDYRIGLPAEGIWTEILNTDAAVYDGTGRSATSARSSPTPSPRTATGLGAGHRPSARRGLAGLEPAVDEEQTEPEKVAAGVRGRGQAGPGLGDPERATPERVAGGSADYRLPGQDNTRLARDPAKPAPGRARQTHRRRLPSRACAQLKPPSHVAAAEARADSGPEVRGSPEPTE